MIRPETPRNPIVLSHGLFGFDTLHLLPWSFIPPLQYWRGINEALQANNCKVIVTAGMIIITTSSLTVEESGDETSLPRIYLSTIWGLALRMLAELHFDNRHSMWNRCKIHDFSIKAYRVQGPQFDHRELSSSRVPFCRLCHSFYWRATASKALSNSRKGGIGNRPNNHNCSAFQQLTTVFMRNDFNPNTPDVDGVKYFSYGASVCPSLLSPFRASHRIIRRVDGENDGLVSIKSASHGVYKGTLVGPSHLDIINWTNRLKWIIKGVLGQHNKDLEANLLHFKICWRRKDYRWMVPGWDNK
ncbi:hypothetical protein TWF106_002810 [Orbilia oligospora]|uniref:Triacylglycerol lipase n=1 Tax=Orbilia oligospora TaxID=2813651 RepID=A0A7C8Q8X6_ORBOL|nr:hypothetical protein TWF106_002810 [Orbilia oligospora]